MVPEYFDRYKFDYILRRSESSQFAIKSKFSLIASGTEFARHSSTHLTSSSRLFPVRSPPKILFPNNGVRFEG